jgi:TPR repeat protein
VEKDEAEAARLFGLATEQGFAEAQYYMDKSMAVDKTKAARLLGQAAEQGHASARWWLGWCCENGQGTGQDARAAVEHYRLAAEGGCADVNVSLGLCFEKGRGVPRSDLAEVARLYALAAEGGAAGKTAYDKAMDVLPDDFLAPGVPCAAFLASTRQAVYQLNLAARLGHVAAAQQLEALAGRRDVVSACCGAVRKLKTCSKCRVARFCDMECTTRMWPAHKASCEAWRAESVGSGTAS